ncbi:carbohydrate ABC transporter permease [Sphaerochaeta sp.]|jgi:raffinose/stachyose/melibiose transport system permease protein|uniref:carbohydrate ABC transporter permease n=1 Tax=Sphaerochaeta sp. TaxID=1972642 RepID=UPI0025855149|nr:carbohydrate ABC transporter permease [Sphaerochaeta sp.]MDD3457307.1 carbohydrate ABC transporter permease [Sphaerochaeta sp.]MDX9984526.1 carbohydrate ABC transporter permease [Sphaerochaeta sp.]NCB66677.1 carbohydrate ABC transporter permease [Bacilli bacterium]
MTSYAVRRRMGKTLLALFLFAFVLAQVFPLLWVASYSLQKSGDLFGPELFKLPVNPVWNNYVRAWTDGKIPQYLTNTLLVVIPSVTFSTLFSFCIAYACTRMQWKLRTVAWFIITIGLTIPIHTTLLPNFIWYNFFGLIDTRIGLILSYVAFSISFNAIIFSGLLTGLPYSMEESAFLDGATYRHILSSIIAPMTATGFATVGVQTFLNHWNEFIMANTYLMSEAKRTLPFSIIRFQGQYSSDYAVQFACMTLVALPPLLLYFIFNRWIVAGVTAGAVKG